MKVKIDREIYVFFSYYIVFLVELNFNRFYIEEKLVIFEILGDVFIFSYEDGVIFFGSIMFIFLYKLLIKYVVLLM